MSTFSKPFLRIQGGITITPDAGPFASAQAPLKLAVDKTGATDATGGFAARIIFGAAAQTAEFFKDGSIVTSASGTRQVETATVTAAAGATSNGNLTVTVTKSGLAGSPLAITVPLRTNTHTTATKIAAAIRDALNANAAFAAVLEALLTENATVVVRSIYPAANETGMNVAITAGLGVSAAANSANTTAGVAGVIVERLGGDAEDAMGGVYPDREEITALFISCEAASLSVESSSLGLLYDGQWVGKKGSYSAELLTAAGTAILDVFILTK